MAQPSAIISQTLNESITNMTNIFSERLDIEKQQIRVERCQECNFPFLTKLYQHIAGEYATISADEKEPMCSVNTGPIGVKNASTKKKKD